MVLEVRTAAEKDMTGRGHKGGSWVPLLGLYFWMAGGGGGGVTQQPDVFNL